MFSGWEGQIKFLLADAATVREGLLHVLGAGVNIVRRPSYPGPLGLSLAILFEVSSDGEPQHAIHVRLTGDDDILLAEVVATTTELPPPPTAGLPALVPVAISLNAVLLPRAGRYRIGMSVDGEPAADLAFDAQQATDEELAVAPASGGVPNARH